MAGRNGKYETHIEPNFKIILGYLRSDYTEKSIAKRFGVSIDSWCSYKKKHPEFCRLVKKGSQDSKALIVNALYKRAKGFSYEEVHTEIKTVGGGPKGKDSKDLSKESVTKVIRKIKKFVPPDVGAIAIVIFNRLNRKWRNKQNIQESGDDSGEKLVRFSFAPPTNLNKKQEKNKNEVDGGQNADKIASED
jgi:hypothetical protein